MDKKTCSKCGETKPVDAFHSARSGYCRPCANQYRREWSARNPDKWRQYRRNSRVRNAKSIARCQYTNAMQRLYGLTRPEYDVLLFQQSGRCAICVEPSDSLSIDHCHNTGRVRGLLCRSCNTALGKVKDMGERLQLMVQYLEKAASAGP